MTPRHSSTTITRCWFTGAPRIKPLKCHDRIIQDSSCTQVSQACENIVHDTRCHMRRAPFEVWPKHEKNGWPISSVRKSFRVIAGISTGNGMRQVPTGCCHPVQSLGRSFTSLGLICSMIRPAHARTYIGEMDIGTKNSQIENGETGPWIVLMWSVGLLLAVMVPLLGHRSAHRNAITTSSLAALISGSFVSFSSIRGLTQFWSTFWYVFGSGVSIGSSIWLAMTTRSRTNHILVAVARYLIPVLVFYEAFCNLHPIGGDGRRLGFTPSIPYLAVFASVALNAFINIKVRSCIRFLRWLWEQIRKYPESGTTHQPNRSGSGDIEMGSASR